MPSDKLDRRLAEMISVPSAGRDRLTAGIYLPTDPAEPLSRLETALRKAAATAPLAAKLRDGELMDLVTEGPFEARVESAVAARLMSPEEAEDLLAAERARLESLQVDAS
jgi:acyl-CoA dehydrogenase